MRLLLLAVLALGGCFTNAEPLTTKTTPVLIAFVFLTIGLAEYTGKKHIMYMLAFFAFGLIACAPSAQAAPLDLALYQRAICEQESGGEMHRDTALGPNGEIGPGLSS